MNINDMKEADIKIPSSSVWAAITEAQSELMVKYQEIEGIPTLPMPFQSKEGQVWIKDFLWRTHEELAESEEALHDANEALAKGNLSLAQQHISHMFEELSDAMHFICEAGLIIGISFDADLVESCYAKRLEVGDSIDPEYMKVVGSWFLSGFSKELSTNEMDQVMWGLKFIRDLMHQCSYWLGLVGNTLKNKKWKQTEIVSDLNKFEERLVEAVKHLLYTLVCSGFKPEDVYILYKQKNLVNQWRQKTNY